MHSPLGVLGLGLLTKHAVRAALCGPNSRPLRCAPRLCLAGCHCTCTPWAAVRFLGSAQARSRAALRLLVRERPAAAAGLSEQPLEQAGAPHSAPPRAQNATGVRRAFSQVGLLLSALLGATECTLIPCRASELPPAPCRALRHAVHAARSTWGARTSARPSSPGPRPASRAASRGWERPATASRVGSTTTLAAGAPPPPPPPLAPASLPSPLPCPGRCAQFAG